MIVVFCLLLVTFCLILVTFCRLLATFGSLLIACYFLLIARHFLRVARYCLLVARYFSLVTFPSVVRYESIIWTEKENDRKSYLVCLLLQIKSQSTRGVSRYSAFMGKWPTISHTCKPDLSSRWVPYVFVPSVTQGNEDARWVREFVSKSSSCCFCV